MLNRSTQGSMNYLLYDVIYADKPWEHAKQLAANVLKDESVLPVLPQILDSIDDVLGKDGWLEELGPLAGNHSEADIKRFLTELRSRIVAGTTTTSSSATRIFR